MTMTHRHSRCHHTMNGCLGRFNGTTNSVSSYPSAMVTTPSSTSHLRRQRLLSVQFTHPFHSLFAPNTMLTTAFVLLLLLLCLSGLVHATDSTEAAVYGSLCALCS